MKIKKYSEKYDFTYDGDIANEYAKFIISKFLDEEENGETLENIFYNIAKNELIDDDQDESKIDFVKGELISITKQLYDMAKKIRSIYQIAADKYNL